MLANVAHVCLSYIINLENLESGGPRDLALKVRSPRVTTREVLISWY